MDIVENAVERKNQAQHYSQQLTGTADADVDIGMWLRGEAVYADWQVLTAATAKFGKRYVTLAELVLDILDGKTPVTITQCEIHPSVLKALFAEPADLDDPAQPGEDCEALPLVPDETTPAILKPSAKAKSVYPPTNTVPADIKTFLDRDLWICAMLRDKLSGLEQVTAARIALFLNIESGRCNPGYRLLAKEVRNTKDHTVIIRVVDKLREKGWIGINEESRGGRSNNFVLLYPPDAIREMPEPKGKSNGDSQVTVSHRQTVTPRSPFDTDPTVTPRSPLAGQTVTFSTLNGDFSTPQTVTFSPPNGDLGVTYTARTAKENSEGNSEESNRPPDPPVGSDTGSQKSKRRAKTNQPPQTTIPPDFRLSDSMIAFGEKNGWSTERCKVEFEHFMAHHQSQGSRMVDWPAAWRTWVLRGLKIDHERSQAKGAAVKHSNRMQEHADVAMAWAQQAEGR